jgi:sulfate-transporting ATPase
MVIGLGLGGVYALLSQGLVLIYRGSGVVNLAQGAIGYLAAIVFYEVSVVHRLPTALAVVISIGLSMLVGVLIQLLVMRPMRKTSSLVRLLATLGLMLTIENLIDWRTNENSYVLRQWIPHGAFRLSGGVAVGTDRVVIFVIAVGITGVLWLVYGRTRFGLITSAAAEDEDSATALGHSPQRIAAINWMAGSAFAGLAGILVAPIVGLAPSVITLLVIPALACALVGGFRSFPLTLLGALAIGVIQSELALYSTFPGWSESVPFLLIIGVLFLRGRPLPVRRYVVERLPLIGSGQYKLWKLSPFVVVAIAGMSLVPGRWQSAMTLSLIGILLCLSLVVVTGLAGQVSLCQMGFAGMAAWAAGRLTADYGVPFVVAIAVGGLFMIPVGLLVGVPALRTRGVNLAIATFGVATVFDSLVFTNPALTGGFGGTNSGEPSIFGWSVYSNRYPWRYLLVALVLATLGAFAVANLRRSAPGRRLIAVRSDERAAASLGIGVFASKLYAFVVSAVLAGVGGVLLAFQNPNIVFSSFSSTQSLFLVMYIVLAGIGMTSGAVLGGMQMAGGVIAFAAVSWFHGSALYQAISGMLLVMVLVINPDGLIPGHIRQFLAVRNRVRRVRGESPIAQTHSPQRHAVSSSVVAVESVAKKDRSDTPAVTVEGLSVRFGGVAALTDVSLTAFPGEVLGLIGPNGAGKTTMLDALSGFISNYDGTISIGGRVVDRESPATRSSLGLRRTFQSVGLFEDLTVYENLLVACEPHRATNYLSCFVRPSASRLTETAEAAIEEFQLWEDLQRRPSELPYGRRRLAGIAQAVAVPVDVLLLDEPAAGLDSAESRELGNVIRGFADRRNAAVILVEHDFDLVMALCDRLIVLDFGEVIAEGPPAVVNRSSRVRTAYLGEVTAESERGSQVGIA